MLKLALLVLVVSAACTKVDSASILTSGMHADIDARATADGVTTVRTTLMLGNPINLDFIELQSDDELVATHGTMTKLMIESELLNAVSYSADFTTNAEGEIFEVSLERSVDAGAPSSLATLPAPFTITPPASATFSRASAMTLTWDTSGAAPDRMRLRITGDCISAFNETLTGDPGTVTVPAGTIQKQMEQPGEPVANSCGATIELTRVLEGELDAGYGAGGSAVGTQVRTLAITSTQ